MELTSKLSDSHRRLTLSGELWFKFHKSLSGRRGRLFAAAPWSALLICTCDFEDVVAICRIALTSSGRVCRAINKLSAIDIPNANGQTLSQLLKDFSRS